MWQVLAALAWLFLLASHRLAQAQDGLRVPKEKERVVVTKQDLELTCSPVNSTYMVIHNTVIPIPDDLIPF